MLFITISLAMGAFSRRMNDRTGKASALVCATKKDLEDAGFILKAGELMRLRGKRTAERSPRNPSKEEAFSFGPRQALGRWRRLYCFPPSIDEDQ